MDGLIRHDVKEEDVTVAWVPGAFEIPVVAKKMAKSGKYDAVICLGAVIRGATSHYDYVCNEVSKGAKANVRVLEDGDKWLIYNRKKTGTLARVKLLPEALELVARYEDGARDTLFPMLSTNRVRIDLITICKLAETSKTYSYHSGRHSFASLITLEAGVPMETICKMLGHKDVKMTQRYARVTQKKLFEDMDKFIAATEKDFILAL